MKKIYVIIIVCFLGVVLFGAIYKEPVIEGTEESSETVSDQTEHVFKKYDFDNFTVDDAMHFVKEEGIAVPEWFDQQEDYEEVLKMILYAYNHPGQSLGYSRVELYELSNKIAEKVYGYTKKE